MDQRPRAAAAAWSISGGPTALDVLGDVYSRGNAGPAAAGGGLSSVRGVYPCGGVVDRP